MNETTSNGASIYTHKATLGGEEMLLSAETMTEVLDGLVKRHPGAGVPQVVALVSPVSGAAEQSEREFSSFVIVKPVFSDFGAGNQVAEEKSLATAGDAGISKGSAASQKPIGALDEKVRRVHELRYAVNMSMWALGAALNNIRLTRMWELRRTHANWKQFCAVELKMSVASADRLIFISQRFTEDQTRAFGIARLCEIRRAPEQHWPALLNLCEGGATARDIRGHVAAIQLAARKSGKTRVLLRRAGGKDTTKATLAAAEVREVERLEKAKTQPLVQPALRAQDRSIAFMARKSPGEKAAKPAKRIAQQPHASITIEGVGTIAISLFEGDDGTICADAKFELTGRVS